MDVRELALDIFLETEKTGAYTTALLRSVMDKYDYEEPKEKAFLKRLCEGTLERRITLDWAIDCCSRTPVRKMKPLIRSLLRLSAYQILYMEAIPDSAACNEAVKLAKKEDFPLCPVLSTACCAVWPAIRKPCPGRTAAKIRCRHGRCATVCRNG